jgi:hypothetical protein
MHDCPVDDVEALRRVNDHTDPTDVSAAWDQNVERLGETKSVERAESSRRRSAQPTRLTDIVDQPSEVSVVAIVEAALNSASKLTGELSIGHRRTTG